MAAIKPSEWYTALVGSMSVAERQIKALVMRGNHICYQTPIPERWPNETQDHWEGRCADFARHLLRYDYDIPQSVLSYSARR